MLKKRVTRTKKCNFFCTDKKIRIKIFIGIIYLTNPCINYIEAFLVNSNLPFVLQKKKIAVYFPSKKMKLYIVHIF